MLLLFAFGSSLIKALTFHLTAVSMFSVVSLWSIDLV